MSDLREKVVAWQDQIDWLHNATIYPDDAEIIPDGLSHMRVSHYVDQARELLARLAHPQPTEGGQKRTLCPIVDEGGDDNRTRRDVDNMPRADVAQEGSAEARHAQGNPQGRTPRTDQGEDTHARDPGSAGPSDAERCKRGWEFEPCSCDRCAKREELAAWLERFVASKAWAPGDAPANLLRAAAILRGEP